jgi:hypothetical protein
MDSIKEAIKKENYLQGYELCEELLKTDSKYNNNYQCLSFLAMCSMKVEKKEDRYHHHYHHHYHYDYH